MANRLCRSRSDAKLGGVCGGLGQYLGIDPTWVRLIFVLVALMNGVGVIIYLVLWLVLPYPDQVDAEPGATIEAGAEEIAARARGLADEVGRRVQQPDPQAARIVGVGLIALGVLFLFKTLGFPLFHWFRFDVLWPVLLIAAGAALLWRRIKGDG